jgi:hypothetical protein
MGLGHGKMNKGIALLGVAVALLLSSEKIRAEDKEPLAVIALGGATEWGFPERKFSFGPSASVEFSAIKDWLEIEVGGARLFRRGRSEWEAEIVFRKPFTLSDTAEFMVGLGPMWTYTKGEGAKLGTTYVLDFMFWPWPERKFGWFVEPSYSSSKGHEKSLAVSVGLLIAIQ